MLSNKFTDVQSECNDQILSGITKLSGAVKSTLGPRGKTVIIEKNNLPSIITKDGVTVAKSIQLQGIEGIAADILKEVAINTNTLAGDGTTTATVLAEAIISESQKLLASGYSVTDLQSEIKQMAEKIIEILKENAIKIDTVEQVKSVAKISANGDESISELIGRAYEKVGRNGVINVDDSVDQHTTLETVDGIRFKKGFKSEKFITNYQKMISEHYNPAILVTSKPFKDFTTNEKGMRAFEKIGEAVKSNNQCLVIIAPSFQGNSMPFFIINQGSKTFTSLCIDAPEFGTKQLEYLKDIAAITGAKVLDDIEYEFDDIEYEWLGSCEKIVANKSETSIINGAGNHKDIQLRIDQLQSQIKNERSAFEREKLYQRKAAMSGGIAFIKVGADSETELREKRDRVDDAISAVKSSMFGGIIAGGGIPLMRLSSNPKQFIDQDYTPAQKVLLRAISAPFKTIVGNADLSPDYVFAKCGQSFNSGFDVANNCYVDDLIEVGIIDPVYVTITALKMAVSVASTLLSTKNVITLIPSQEPVNQNIDYV